MKISTIVISAKLIFVSLAAAQDPGYYCIYGNRDGSTIDVYIDSYIEINNWAATPEYGGTIGFVHNPLASDNNYIASRDSGEFVNPFYNCGHFTAPDTNSPPGYTNQSLLGVFGDYPGCSFLSTNGDTVHIANFFMRTANDSSLVGLTVCPFVEGNHPAIGTTIWGDINGVDAYIPTLTFSCFYFVNYLAGDANGSGDVSGADVIYLVNYCKGFGPPPDPFLGGDVNGDCIVNGMDVVYLVAYFKGGPEPFLGNCH
jgi:hypothetical protein